MRTRLALVLAILLSASSLYGWYTSRSELKAAYASNATLEARARASEELLLQRSRAALEHQHRQQVQNKELSNELSKEPIWSSTPVPVGVTTGLCKHLQCSQ